MGKSAIINNLLKELERDGGTGFKAGSVLGTVLNYSEKQSSLLENISSLTSLGPQGGGERGVDVLLGGAERGRGGPGGPGGAGAGLVSTMVQMSAQTSAHRLQAQIKLRLIKKGRDSMGAPKGRRVSCLFLLLLLPLLLLLVVGAGR